jgi:hypothetical protein
LGPAYFLLDGYDRLQVAAEGGRLVTLLSLLSADGGLASTEQVARVPELRARPAAPR